MTEGISRILWRVVVDEECGMTLFVDVRCALAAPFLCDTIAVTVERDERTQRKETETEKLQTT